MSQHWDEFSKSLAEESLPRRESLRRLGFLFAGAVLSPLGVETARAGGRDPCKTFCRCRNKSQQNACLAACGACNGDTNRLAGSCGSYTCCGAGQTNCGSYCADLGNDWYNCGACGRICPYPGPNEEVACINGNCEYACVEGAVYCNGYCTFLGGDVDNCGGCGNVCPGSAPWCVQGECICHGTVCGDSCVDLRYDPLNCGACGNVCGPDTPDCYNGVCGDYCPPGYGLTFCAQGGYCTNLMADDLNCGACYNVCSGGSMCFDGVCGSPGDPEPWW